MAPVGSAAAILEQELPGLLLRVLGQAGWTLGADVEQDQAALQHVGKGPGLQGHTER